MTWFCINLLNTCLCSGTQQLGQGLLRVPWKERKILAHGGGESVVSFSFEEEMVAFSRKHCFESLLLELSAAWRDAFLGGRSIH